MVYKKLISGSAAGKQVVRMQAVSIFLKVQTFLLYT